MIECYDLDLDDWPDLRDLFSRFKASPHAPKIEMDFETMRTYFLLAQSNPKYGVIGMRIDGVLRAFCILYEIAVPGAALPDGRISMSFRSFIQALYVEGQKAKGKSSALATKYFSAAIDSWAKARGHVEITGSCRLGLGSAAAGLFGYREKYKVMAKDLTETSDVEVEHGV